MAMMGVAFSLVPAVIWPSVAYIVEQNKLGTAYGLMTVVQNMGFFGFNLAIGWANDHGHASAENPPATTWACGYSPFWACWDALCFPAAAKRIGPHGHGLETITASNG